MITKINIGDGDMYMENGQLHNVENQPAWIHSNGLIEYYKHGKLHRTDGPARINVDGSKEFWMDGVYHGKEINGVFHPWNWKSK